MRFRMLVLAILATAVLFYCSHKRKSLTAVQDNDPVALFTAIPGTTALDSHIVFSAAGCSDVEDGLEDLLVRWDWESDGKWDTYFTAGKVDSHIYRTAGIISVTMEVKDTDGNQVRLIKDIYVMPDNLPPTAQFVLLPQYGDTNTQFNVDASFSTDDQDSMNLLEVRWDWESDGTWDNSWTTTKTDDHKYSAFGVKTITLQVRDTKGDTSTAQKQVNVGGTNTAPTACVAVSPEQGTITTEDSCNVACGAGRDDPDDSLTYRGEWDGDGSAEAHEVSRSIVTHMFTTTGAKTVKMKVMDTEGLYAVTQKTVIVKNTEPTAIFTVSPS